jgi:hypothetical protein
MRYDAYRQTIEAAGRAVETLERTSRTDSFPNGDNATEKYGVTSVSLLAPGS